MSSWRPSAKAALVWTLLLGSVLAGLALVWIGRTGAMREAPRERVVGGHSPPAPRVAPELESLDVRALEEAARYAGAHGSQALIVSRHDHIVFERYWHGTGFDTLCDAQSFTPLLAALATGVAVSHRRVGWPQSAHPPLHRARATGERYATYLSEALWRRIGAGDAWLLLDREGGTARADCCMLARQGDWIRIGQLLARDGNYRGDEVMRPGWVALLRAPARGDSHLGGFVRLAGPVSPGAEGYLAHDLFTVQGSGGNRLWVVPSLQIAIVRIANASDSAFAEARIPNLIVRGARDDSPPAAPAGVDVSALVPGHQP